MGIVDKKWQIYLAGKMSGLSFEEMYNWREDAKSRLLSMSNNAGYRLTVINPVDFYNFEKYIESKECDIFLFGHTHKKFAKEIGNTYVFNPGSLTRPRDSSLGSYLILEIKDKNNITYKFKTVEL